MKPIRALMLVVACLTMSGCLFSQSTIAPDRYTGPVITHSQLEGRHMLVVEAPTPGWLTTVDRTERLLDVTRVFVTLRRPDPGMLYPARVVQQDVLTRIVASREIEVFARTMEFGRKAEERPYRRAEIGDAPVAFVED